MPRAATISLVVAGAFALAGVGCGGDTRPEAEAPSSGPGTSEHSPSGAPPPGNPAGLQTQWEKLPDPPISGRVEALVVSVGNTIVVAGGSNWWCPPGANCVTPDTPPFADGAAFDLTAGQWRRISDAPVGFRATVTTVVGDDVYALSQCDLGPECPAGRGLLRYRSGVDEWDLLPGPDEKDYYGLVAVADGVLAYGKSDEIISGRDYRFLAEENRWVALPDDPLPPVFDRFVVEYGGRFMLFGTRIEGGLSRTKLAAAYDPATNAWVELTASGTLGSQVWRVGPLLYLNPHFRTGGGGIYDPATNRWHALPNPPYHDLAGIIGEQEAIYEHASGWVLDTRTGNWLEIGARPDADDVYDATVAVAPEQNLVVFGGKRWPDGGQLLNHTWIWKRPAVIGSSP